MPGRTIELPKSGFALEIDGRLKTELSTKEGAEHGAIELKRRFPMLQIRIYDAGTQSRHDLPGSRLTFTGPGKQRRTAAGQGTLSLNECRVLDRGPEGVRECLSARRRSHLPARLVDVDYKDIDLPSVTSRLKQSPKASDTG
jgi:hypothetical protein